MSARPTRVVIRCYCPNYQRIFFYCQRFLADISRQFSLKLVLRVKALFVQLNDTRAYLHTNQAWL